MAFDAARRAGSGGSYEHDDKPKCTSGSHGHNGSMTYVELHTSSTPFPSPEAHAGSHSRPMGCASSTQCARSRRLHFDLTEDVAKKRVLDSQIFVERLYDDCEYSLLSKNAWLLQRTTLEGNHICWRVKQSSFVSDDGVGFVIKTDSSEDGRVLKEREFDVDKYGVVVAEWCTHRHYLTECGRWWIDVCSWFAFGKAHIYEITTIQEEEEEEDNALLMAARISLFDAQLIVPSNVAAVLHTSHVYLESIVPNLRRALGLPERWRVPGKSCSLMTDAFIMDEEKALEIACFDDCDSSRASDSEEEESEAQSAPNSGSDSARLKVEVDGAYTVLSRR